VPPGSSELQADSLSLSHNFFLPSVIHGEVDDLGLERGVRATGVVKATNVIIEV